jgi:hypothetical protein
LEKPWLTQVARHELSSLMMFAPVLGNAEITDTRLLLREARYLTGDVEDVFRLSIARLPYLLHGSNSLIAVTALQRLQPCNGQLTTRCFGYLQSFIALVT